MLSLLVVDICDCYYISHDRLSTAAV